MNGTDDDAFTLRRLAELAAPILWFSPQEFLLEEDEHAPMPATIPLDGSSKEPTVYFRIRQIRLRSSIPSTSSFGLDDEWSTASNSALPLDHLDRVTIRYYFYYPEDRGIGGHIHDLEAIELQVRIMKVYPMDNAAVCLDAAVLESVAASAHGVGWYTSVLDVFRAPDTVVPLTVLVEENKHASMADRDGDGLYMPHYDINQYGNDGWGIRDVAGTGSLGSPGYAADQSRVLRPFTPDRRVLPNAWNSRLSAAFDAHERNRPLMARSDPTALPRYRLLEAGTSAVCSEGRPNKAAMENYFGAEGPGKLVELVDHGSFCDAMALRTPFNLTVQKVSDVIHAFYPGPRNQYGFMNWAERVSVAYRHDGGHGFSYAGPPIPGTEVPVFGGWLIGKSNVILDSRRVDHASLDALYTPSASRSVGWFASAGSEWQMRRPSGHHRPQLAEEVGVKFRFLGEGRFLKGFFGGRIAVRAAGSDPINHARLVFEFGAGSW
jgi:hypothetical protein